MTSFLKKVSIPFFLPSHNTKTFDIWREMQRFRGFEVFMKVCHILEFTKGNLKNRPGRKRVSFSLSELFCKTKTFQKKTNRRKCIPPPFILGGFLFLAELRTIPRSSSWGLNDLVLNVVVITFLCLFVVCGHRMRATASLLFPISKLITRVPGVCRCHGDEDLGKCVCVRHMAVVMGVRVRLLRHRLIRAR